jgi:hypothetical protein
LLLLDAFVVETMGRLTVPLPLGPVSSLVVGQAQKSFFIGFGGFGNEFFSPPSCLACTSYDKGATKRK